MIEETKEAISQTLDSKIAGWLFVAWSWVAASVNLQDVAVLCSILLTLIMVVRQLIGLRKDLRGGKDADT